MVLGTLPRVQVTSLPVLVRGLCLPGLLVLQRSKIKRICSREGRLTRTAKLLLLRKTLLGLEATKLTKAGLIAKCLLSTKGKALLVAKGLLTEVVPVTKRLPGKVLLLGK